MGASTPTPGEGARHTAGYSKLQNEIPHFGVADWRAYACTNSKQAFNQFGQIAHVFRAVGLPQMRRGNNSQPLSRQAFPALSLL